MESASTPAERGGGGPWRALAVILFLLLLLGAAIMIAVATDIAGTTLCRDVTAQSVVQDPNGECYDGSSFQKVITVAFGYAGGAVGVLAAFAAIAYTVTGRRGRLVVIATVAALVLSGISIGIGSI